MDQNVHSKFKDFVQSYDLSLLPPTPAVGSDPAGASSGPPTLTFNEQDKKNLEHALTLLPTNRQAGEKIFLGITSSRDQQGPLADKPPSGLGQDLGASRSCCLKQLARQQLASGGRLNF